MKHALATLLLVVLSCGASRAAEPVPDASFPVRQLPDCPYPFPVVEEERLQIVAGVVQRRVGVPAGIQGPYTDQILTWIAEHGRRIEASGTTSRIDFVDAATKDRLIEKKGKEGEIFFYYWESNDGHSAQWGFVVLRDTTIVDVVTLMHT